jgi:ATP-dependent Clp protease ATP-binding subunit ClpB
VRRRLSERRIELVLTDEARRLIADTAYDPVFGARPLRRYIQREVETRIARALLAGEILDGARVTVDAGPDGLEVRPERPERRAETEPEPGPAAA